MFRVGQEVVCIVHQDHWSHDWIRLYGMVDLPVKDDVYTISKFGMPFNDGSLSICLIGFNQSISFEARGFRPLIKVEDFTTIDAPAPKENVDA